MSAPKGKYVCKKCSAGYVSNQGLQRHLGDKKAHTAAVGAGAGGGGQATAPVIGKNNAPAAKSTPAPVNTPSAANGGAGKSKGKGKK